MSKLKLDLFVGQSKTQVRVKECDSAISVFDVNVSKFTLKQWHTAISEAVQYHPCCNVGIVGSNKIAVVWQDDKIDYSLLTELFDTFVPAEQKDETAQYTLCDLRSSINLLLVQSDMQYKMIKELQNKEISNGQS